MIPHNSPTCGVEEAEAAAAVISLGWLAQGREVAAFENEICAFLGLPDGHAVAVSSGTAALYLALHALDARGKRVAFPAYACAALRNAVALAQGEEQLLDVAPGSPNLDPQAALGSAPDVLIAPHLYGLPIDLQPCAGLPVIEDCAQALGARVRESAVGLQGTMGIFSFYATKMITTGGQGGMVVSHERALVDAVRDYREFDCRHDRTPRFNFQMTDLQAAIGRVQLRRLPGFIARRERLFAIYREAGLSLLDVPATMPHLAPVRYRAVVRTRDPARAVQALAAQGIRAIVPLEDWELLGEAAAFPHAWEMTRTTVSLPVFPALSDAQAETIAAILQEVE